MRTDLSYGKCRERDKDTCVMTGMVDRAHLRELDDWGILDETYPNGLPPHADMEVCHIIPISTDLSEGNRPEVRGALSFLVDTSVTSLSPNVSFSGPR